MIVVSDTIIVAILALVGTLTGAWLSNRKTSALVAYRIEQLEEKVNKHNSIIERTYNIEKHNAVVDEQIDGINHRLDDLEDKQ